eukprot:SAG22_NODE_4366_length_1291_cov_2.568792_1_plen_173_part_00
MAQAIAEAKKRGEMPSEEGSPAMPRELYRESAVDRERHGETGTHVVLTGKQQQVCVCVEKSNYKPFSLSKYLDNTAPILHSSRKHKQTSARTTSSTGEDALNRLAGPGPASSFLGLPSAPPPPPPPPPPSLVHLPPPPPLVLPLPLPWLRVLQPASQPASQPAGPVRRTRGW